MKDHHNLVATAHIERYMMWWTKKRIDSGMLRLLHITSGRALAFMRSIGVAMSEREAVIRLQVTNLADVIQSRIVCRL